MKNIKKNIRFRIPKQIHQQMMMDLRRPHPFAYERVGFLLCKTKYIKDQSLLIIATEYIVVEDHDYLEDESVGAKINATAIRKAMQTMLDKRSGCFHVHLHDHHGLPSPSFTDKKGISGVVESFEHIDGNQANGMLILSDDLFYCIARTSSSKEWIVPELISIVGYPMKYIYAHPSRGTQSNLFSRQAFLGGKSQSLFKRINVGIIGYGGGGSHIGMQLAHIGIENIYVFDYDKVEDSNLNRLVGAWFSDIQKSILKTQVAKRIIQKILPSAKVHQVISRWQDYPEILQNCDMVLGCVDSYSERNQLEAECRRYLIPYIDIGMDVNKLDSEPYTITGQVILSMPGMPCMNCVGFITERKLGIEAKKYGNVGGRPQVVWPNGVLASTAIGIFVDLITNWTEKQDRPIYLAYDGNTGIIENHIRLRFAEGKCTHYELSDSGPPTFTRL